jgi:hypothetical protein
MLNLTSAALKAVEGYRAVFVVSGRKLLALMRAWLPQQGGANGANARSYLPDILGELKSDFSRLDHYFMAVARRVEQDECPLFDCCPELLSGLCGLCDVWQPIGAHYGWPWGEEAPPSPDDGGEAPLIPPCLFAEVDRKLDGLEALLDRAAEVIRRRGVRGRCGQDLIFSPLVPRRLTPNPSRTGRTARSRRA